MTSRKCQFGGAKVHVSDAFDLRMGKTPSRKNPAYWREGNHDWVSIADLGSFGKYVGRTKEKINDLAISESGIAPAPANSVLMSFKLSLGKTSITREPVYTNEAIMAFIDKGTYLVDTDYLYHQCKSKDWSNGINAAVMGNTLNKKSLGQAYIILPSINEQKRIACLLDCIEGLIDKAIESENKIDCLIKSRFVEMFGDPMLGGPAWEKKRLGDIASVITGNTPSRKHPEYYGDFIEWVKTDNINTVGGIDEANERLSEEGMTKARVVNAGSILMACIAGSVESIGRVGLVDRRVAFNQQINAIVPGNRVLSEYLLWVFKLSKDYLCRDINMQLKGILNKTALSAKCYAVPPLELQREFTTFVRQADKLRVLIQQQKEKLQMLYDSLAQEYFAV